MNVIVYYYILNIYVYHILNKQTKKLLNTVSLNKYQEYKNQLENMMKNKIIKF